MDVVKGFPCLSVSLVTFAFGVAEFKNENYEKRPFETCGNNATRIEATPDPRTENYRETHDPAVVGTLHRDEVAIHSDIFDHRSVGLGVIACINNGGKLVLTKTAAEISVSMEQAERNSGQN